jgi:signal peptidase II
MSHHLVARVAAFLLLTAVGSGCDLQTKAWAEATLVPLPGQTLEVVAPWLDFVLTYNHGTAFSAVGDLGDLRSAMGVLSLLVVVVLLGAVIRAAYVRADRPAVAWTTLVAYAAIAGGAVGNGYDRLFREAPSGVTGVVDFIRVNYPWGGHWPVFNVADVLLVVGAVLLLIAALLNRRSPNRMGPKHSRGPAPEDHGTLPAP